MASGPMSATSGVEGDGVAGPLAHLDRLVAVHQGDHLAELDLEAAGVDAEGLDPGHQAGHLAMVVGAEHVDHPVESADQELVAVIGEVAGQVGGVAVGLAQHPVAGVAQLGGPEPGGAVLLEDQALVGQQGDGLVDRPALLDGGLAVPLVEDDAHRGERGPDAVEDLVGRPAAGRGHVVGPVIGGGQFGHVLALVAALWDLVGHGAGPAGSPQGPDLSAGVVDVVLAADLVSGAGQHPGQGVAVTAPPAVAHMDGAGRVGRDELDLHPFAMADVRSGVAVLTLVEQVAPGPRAASRRRAGS